MEANVAEELAEVRRRFVQWRKGNGGRGSRIPAELWNEAARVARKRGVYATARALRLNYEGLKTRVAAGEAKATQAGFVELQVGSPAATGAVVELVGPAGEQMRIHLSGVRAPELVALAQAFWSRMS
jgi:hypothetical protein